MKSFLPVFDGTGQVGLQGKTQSTSLVLMLVLPKYQPAKVSLIVWFPTRYWVQVSSVRVWQWTRQESAKIPVVLEFSAGASWSRNCWSKESMLEEEWRTNVTLKMRMLLILK